MKKASLVLLLLLLPSILVAQGTVRVSSMYGPVEWRGVSSGAFVAMPPSMQAVGVGDEIRTGPGGTLMLELPDGSYMVVSENSTLQIQEAWGSNLNNLVNVFFGKVRFYIQKLGGRTTPYHVGTPTALIAVRGTTFEVIVDEAQFTEIHCLEGRVAVETVGLPDREVILEPGRKTLVRPGEYPLTPVAIEEALARNRVLRVVKKSPAESNTGTAPSLDVLVRDNDRRNRAIGIDVPLSQTNGEVQRSKPALTYP
jgi:ferric-dicitrate binding protein FerR (iron transport regulator)